MTSACEVALCRKVSKPALPSSVLAPAPPARTSSPGPPVAVRGPAYGPPTMAEMGLETPPSEATTPATQAAVGAVPQRLAGVQSPVASPVNESFPGPPWKTKVPGAAAVDQIILTSTKALVELREPSVLTSRPLSPSAMLPPPTGARTVTFERMAAEVWTPASLSTGPLVSRVTLTRVVAAPPSAGTEARPKKPFE